MSALGDSKRCPQCGALAPLNAPLCATCGREFQGTVGTGAPGSALPPVVAPVAPPPLLGAVPPGIPDDDEDDDLPPAHSEAEAEAGTRLSLGLVAIFVVGTVLLVILSSVLGSRSKRDLEPVPAAVAPIRTEAPAPVRAPVIASPGDVAVEDPPSGSATAENEAPEVATPGPSAPRPIVPGPPRPGAPSAPVGPPVTVVGTEIVPEIAPASNAETETRYGARVTLRNDGSAPVTHVRADVTARDASGALVFELRDVELLSEGTTLAPRETITIEPGSSLTCVGNGADPPTQLRVLIVGISL